MLLVIVATLQCAVMALGCWEQRFPKETAGSKFDATAPIGQRYFVEEP